MDYNNNSVLFTEEVSRPRNRFLRVWRKQVIRLFGTAARLS